MTLAQRIKGEARRLGFAGVGIVPAADAETHAFYVDWLAAGHAGEMAYLHRHGPLKQHPRHVHEPVRSIIVLTHNYQSTGLPEPRGTQGRVSRYALGRDYHDLLRDKLRALASFVDEAAGRPVASRPAVDSAPLMEREYAARAGLGWVGKHANLIDWEQGSWLFIAELLVDLVLDYDAPRPPDQHAWRMPEPAQASAPPPLRMMESCGSCTACIDACPTGAIVADKTVDARRCISYLTIELRGPLPPEWRRGIGDWIFGCDVCQAVCPWNRTAPTGEDAELTGDAARAALDLIGLLQLDGAGFREQFRHTAMARPRRRGLLRNAATALGNLLAGQVPGRGPLSGQARRRAIAALTAALGDGESLVRGAAAWALGEARARDAAAALAQAAAQESDSLVREELAAARQRLDETPSQERMPGR